MARIVLVILLFLAALYPASALVPKQWTGGGNNLDLSVLRPGDIILCRGCA